MSDRAAHFASPERARDAAYLGMWVFLASEVLLFGGLFVIYTAGRLHYPGGFELGLAHADKTLGSLNTGILLCSSFTAASAVTALRAEHRRRTLGLLALSMLLGTAFLALKLHEYALHFADGIRPGGEGSYFAEHAAPGLSAFWTLYYLMTGLHVVHLLAGLGALGYAAWQVWRGGISATRSHPLALVAMYWHLVDVVWIFLWPLFYLTGPS